MIFPYVNMQREGRVRTLPLVPIRVIGPSSSADVLALVDSGAEHSVLPLRLMEVLGLSPEGSMAVNLIGVGGLATRGYLRDVELQLSRHHWTAPVVFSTAIDVPSIVGQAGFFAFFTVTFRYHDRYPTSPRLSRRLTGRVVPVLTPRSLLATRRVEKSHHVAKTRATVSIAAHLFATVRACQKAVARVAADRRRRGRAATVRFPT